ncbi:MAG: hypothetical protein IKW44_07855, partial [Bacteroidaceae bacterium]|nr:hypothetical protein [Bacteroidaceae bacterium]
LPVRQFSKLVVSATHPNFLLHSFKMLSEGHPSQMRCKGRRFLRIVQVFQCFFSIFVLNFDDYP